MGSDRSRVKVLILQDHPLQMPLSTKIQQLLSQHKGAEVSALHYNFEGRRWHHSCPGEHCLGHCIGGTPIEQYEVLAWPDLMLVSCMQADTLAKMLHGITDSPLLDTLRSWDVSKKVAIIPAMSLQMWENPMTKKQLSKIRRKWHWIRVLEPLTWDVNERPSGAVWSGMQECVDVLKNQIDLLLLGHDHVPTGGGNASTLVTNNDKQIRLPSEIWSIILQFTDEWELAKTLDIYTNLQVPAEWQRHPFTYGQSFMRDLEWAILTGKLHDVAHLFQTHGSPKSLSNLCVKLIIRFARTDILSYLEDNHDVLFWSQFGHTLLPTKASAFFGQTAVLDWWQRSPTFLSKEYNNDAMDFASKSGFVHVLEWWRCSGLPLRYTDAALEQASSQGHIAVLHWWRGASNYRDIPSGQSEGFFASATPDNASRIPETERIPPLPLKVGKALIYAAQNGQTAAIRWWMSSSIPTVHEDAVARTASAHGHVNVLQLWKEMKGEKMQYDHQVLVGPTKNQHANVLEWWKTSGYRVEYKTCDIEEALEDSRGGAGEDDIRRWWAKNGLNLGVGTSEWMMVKIL
ncbi:MAG: hypothetical protein L6R38_001451 [Xanthoria sp. 2 TBL-2021]|nr:MAG: hypothetical protein L6R38_001451 [Xanthoria sp. 2 TBL-2021]